MAKGKKGVAKYEPDGANLPPTKAQAGKKSSSVSKKANQKSSEKGWSKLKKVTVVLSVIAVLVSLEAYHVLYGGVWASPLCTYFGVSCPQTFIKGFVLPGYEPIRDVFLAMKEKGNDLGSQVSVWHHGREVVNLWGGYKDYPTNSVPYENNTLNVIYSSGKVVTALTMAILADRGLIEYEAPIVKYWPEFAASCNGSSDCDKAKITIQDLMSMSGRIPYLDVPNPNPWSFLHDLDQVKAAIERSPLVDTAILPVDEPELPFIDTEVEAQQEAVKEAVAGEAGKGYAKQRCYHAITRGLIAQQILKNVDPKHRAFGQFIKDEILDPINNNRHAGVDKAEHHIGLPVSEHHRMATLVDMPIVQDVVLLAKYFLDKLGFYKADPSLPVSIDLAADPKSVLNIVLASLDPKFNAPTCSTPNYWILQSPDAASTTNAHSMAMIGALLAGKGALNGTRVISEAGLARGMQSRGRIPDFYYAGITKPAWTAAGWCILDDGYSKVNGEGWYGTGGFGGSINAWNQKYNASIAYAMNGMLSSIDNRYILLTDALMGVLERMDAKN